jgi:hypothetical protein
MLRSEEEKLTLIDDSRQHLELAKRERQYYKDVIAQTRQSIEGMQLVNGQPPCSGDFDIHLSFDMAQQVHIPSNPLQPGPLYFLTPFRIAIFGVMNDTIRKQTNFLIPESVDCGKGANMIVSLLYSYLLSHNYGQKRLFLHADNCRAQNKNNIMLWFLMFCVLAGFYEEVTYSFLIVGHTKFTVDWAFGILKSAFRRYVVSTIQQLIAVISGSTPVSKVNDAVAVGNEAGEVFIPTYDWKAYFTQYRLKKLANLTRYQHFTFRKSHPGIVFVKETCDGPESQVCVISETDLSQIDVNLANAAVVHPAGMSAVRKAYLAKEIRPYCPDDAKDILCPEYVPAVTTNIATSPIASTSPSTIPAAGPAVPRGRGRPRKVVAAKPPHTDSDNHAGPSVPRRRGRPRKVVAAKPTPHSDSDDHSDAVDDPDSPEPVPPVRRPGRPKKKILNYSQY